MMRKKKMKKRMRDLNKSMRKKKEEDRAMMKVIVATAMKKVKMKETLAMMEKTKRKIRLVNLKLMI